MPLARLIDEFDRRSKSCSSDTELGLLVADAAHELGFDYFALLHHSSLRWTQPTLIRIDNYPDGWVEEMIEKDFVVQDPVHLASARTNIGFSWDQLGALVAMTRLHHDILAQSRRYGMGTGFTVPANVPGEPGGSCSFAVRCGRELPIQRLLCAEQVGAHAFRVARQLHGFPASGRQPHLSRREQQCLQLLAAGKSDWEIGKILGVSHETARQYVKRARSAYDVVSRTQLVVHGLRDAWISFDDSIPPDGGMG